MILIHSTTPKSPLSYDYHRIRINLSGSATLAACTIGHPELVSGSVKFVLPGQVKKQRIIILNHSSTSLNTTTRKTLLLHPC